MEKQEKQRKQRRKRRAFTAEFKAEAVRLCRVGDRTVRDVARDLDLTETALREWVRRADADGSVDAPLKEDERAELQRLRRENKRLQMERDILKKAYCILYKRLHRARFQLPSAIESERPIATLDPRAFGTLLRGVEK
jgi:transposase